MGMFLRQWFVLLGFRYLYSGANVILSTTGGLNNSDISQCNTTKTVICHIERYTLMTWTIDNKIVADCTLNVCSPYPALPANAVFSFAPNAGIFNLTFNQVRLTDSGKEIKCSNGTSTTDKHIIENVKDCRVTLLEGTGPDGTEIKVISGCISSSTNLTFVWNKIKVNTSDVEKYTGGNESMSKDNVSCSSDPVCGSSETEQHTNLLIVTETEEKDGGVDYYLQSVVTFHENDFLYSVTTESTKTYKLPGGIPCKILCVIVCKLLVACGVLLVVAVIVGLCLLLYMILRPTAKEDNTDDKWSTSTPEILLHTFSAVLWIVIASLFICLVIRCNCKDTCDYCVELPLGIVFGILFFIHLVLWFILLYVLYNRTEKGDNEGDIHFKTKLEKVRMIFSTIPLVGLFPVCGWLIRIYRCEKCTIHDEQLTIEEKKHQLPSKTKPNLANPKTEETGKQNLNTDRKERKKEQDKLHNFVDMTIGLREKSDQLSASDVIIVKPSGTDKVKHTRSSTSGEKSTKRKVKAYSEDKTNKSQKGNSAFTISGTKQLSQNNVNVITSSQEHNTERKKNMSDSENLVSYSEETSRRKMDLTEIKTGSENNPGSKDDVKRDTKKSRKSEDESKHPLNTNMVCSEAHTGTMELTETKTGSENKPGSKDDVKHEKKISRKAKDEIKNPQNTNMVSADAHTWNIDVTTTGSEDKLGSSDNDNPSNSSMSGKALPRRKESRKEKDGNKNPRNTKPGSADSHNGSETMKRALSANFDDEEDATPTVSIVSSTNM